MDYFRNGGNVMREEYDIKALNPKKNPYAKALKKQAAMDSAEDSADPFYSEANIRYLEKIAQDVKDGTAHFAEHDLIKPD